MDESAARRWSGRAAAEAASAEVFDAIAAELMDVLPGSHFADTLRAVASDERRHAALAARHAPADAAPPAELTLPSWQGATPAIRLLEQVTFLLAAGETFAVATLQTALDGPTRPEIRATLQSILSDERRHADIGWQLVEAIAGTLTPQDRAAAAQPVSRAAFLASYAAIRVAPSVSDPAHGVLSTDEVSACVNPVLRTEVWPRLVSLGLAARRTKA